MKRFLLILVPVVAFGAVLAWANRAVSDPPSNPRELIDNYERDAQQIRQKADREVAALREKLIEDLKAIHQGYIKTGRTDEAQAVRLQIARLMGETTQATTVQADPGTLKNYRGQNGKVLYFEVTGTTRGTVFGTDEYTDDSSLATAAVHAGVLKDGEKGVVKVTILQGKQSYSSTERNGIHTNEWGAWYGSYKVEASDLPGKAPILDVKADPGSMTGYRGQNGKVFHFEVTGATTGAIYGDGIYTDDSSLKVVVVHAGLLKDGEKGVVKVTILPGQQSYPSVQRNGITTSSWGEWVGSYKVELAKKAEVKEPAIEVKADPGTVGAYRGQNGKVFYFEVTGVTAGGTVWGTDVYTDDSHLARAAVHAGVLKDGEKGVVKVTILAGQDSYQGSERNGVSTSEYGSWGGSFKIEAGPARKDQQK